ncbi:MAG: hypothetical protein ACI9IJ_001988 [Psychromonas sp.]|jgi:hypothetical protein
MLGHATTNKKSELTNVYFSEMSEICVSCHTAFATHKFPTLAPIEKGEHGH